VTPPRFVVLYSGGLDSTVLLAWALRRGPVATLTLDHPQRPRGEREAAGALLDHFRVRRRHTLAYPTGVPTWIRGGTARGHVPGRNLFQTTAALLLARRLGARWVVAGHLRTDGQSFGDARRPFFDALEELADADRPSRTAHVGILTPFLGLDKAALVGLGRSWQVPLEATWSCYRDGEAPCGTCVACRERARAFTAAPEPRARARARRRPRARGGLGGRSGRGVQRGA
jgi:7-cyano-7-deazaguanine synthase